MKMWKLLDNITYIYLGIVIIIIWDIIAKDYLFFKGKRQIA